MNNKIKKKKKDNPPPKKIKVGRETWIRRCIKSYQLEIQTTLLLWSTGWSMMPPGESQWPTAKE
jgi:hypothetical protein